MSANDKIATRVRELATEKNLTYYELSYKSAVPLTTLNHIVNGSTKNPGIITLMKICNGFGITIIDFFSTEEMKNIEEDIE